MPDFVCTHCQTYLTSKALPVGDVECPKCRAVNSLVAVAEPVSAPAPPPPAPEPLPPRWRGSPSTDTVPASPPPMPEPLPLPVPLADPFAGMGQYEFASFCPDCLGTTTPVSTGTLHPGGYFGFGLLEERRSWCERCGSRVGRVWFCLLLLPVLPLARYRIIYVWGGGEGEIHFLARQLRETDQRERIKGKVFWACFLLGLIGGALVLGVERTFLGGLVGYALFMLWFLKRPK